MNIFFLDKDPVWAAQYHVDKHVVKMIQETAQLLSTAHRVLDGSWHKEVLQPAVYRNLCTLGWSGRVDCAARLLPGEQLVFVASQQGVTDIQGWTIVNKKAMQMTHYNHPSAIWARESKQNYEWLYRLFLALCYEKDHRYPGGPNNTLKQYGDFLANPPKNIPDTGFTEPTSAMPAGYKVKRPDGSFDSVASYRRYYIGDKYHFAKWTNRSIPRWFLQGLGDVWADEPEPRVKLLSDPKVAKKTQISLNHVKKYLPDVYNRMVV